MKRRGRIRRPRRAGGRRPRVADALAVVRDSREAKANDTARGRRRRSVVASLLLHAMLFTFLLVAQPSLDEAGTLDRDRLHRRVGAAAAALFVAAVRTPAKPVAGAPAPGRKETRFAREEQTAQQQPVPQDDYTLSDQLASRLAAMRSTSQRPTSGLPTPDLPMARSSAVLAKASTSAPQIALQRGTAEVKPVPSIALRRSARGEPARVSPMALPAEAKGSQPAAAGSDATARVRLAGGSAGPVANRPILSHAAPAYPDWAKRDAVEASVTLRFVVRPDGSIKENLLVERTSGYQDFDDRALLALSVWRFAPLHEGRTGDQWGVITLYFRLREAQS